MNGLLQEVHEDMMRYEREKGMRMKKKQQQQQQQQQQHGGLRPNGIIASSGEDGVESNYITAGDVVSFVDQFTSAFCNDYSIDVHGIIHYISCLLFVRTL